MTVTAKNHYDNVATGYVGTVHFTSNDPNHAIMLPSDYTFVAGDTGSHTFTNEAALITSGTRTITATDTLTSTINGTSGNIEVDPAMATILTVTAPASATAGASFDVTVTAKDKYDNVATGYAGSVAFTSTDPNTTHVVLPAGYTFLPGDNGTHTFTLGATLITAGSQTITATDTVTSTITGFSGSINLGSAAAARLGVVASKDTVTAFETFDVTVTAFDAYDNIAVGYVGTVKFSSTDTSAEVPVDYTFSSGSSADNGVHTFTGLVLKTGGSQTVTVDRCCNNYHYRHQR